MEFHSVIPFLSTIDIAISIQINRESLLSIEQPAHRRADSQNQISVQPSAWLHRRCKGELESGFIGPDSSYSSTVSR